MTFQYLKQIPITKAPNKFVINVCQGKQDLPNNKINALNIEPIAPPLATNKKNFKFIKLTYGLIKIKKN